MDQTKAYCISRGRLTYMFKIFKLNQYGKTVYNGTPNLSAYFDKTD